MQRKSPLPRIWNASDHFRFYCLMELLQGALEFLWSACHIHMHLIMHLDASGTQQVVRIKLMEVRSLSVALVLNDLSLDTMKALALFPKAFWLMYSEAGINEPIMDIGNESAIEWLPKRGKKCISVIFRYKAGLEVWSAALHSAERKHEVSIQKRQYLPYLHLSSILFRNWWSVTYYWCFQLINPGTKQKAPFHEKLFCGAAE